MISATRRQRKAPPEPKRISIKAWTDGYQSTRDSNRTSEKGLRATLNQILKQDGTVGPRPSRVRFGPQPIGTVLGEITEFTKRSSGTSTNYMISVQVVGGVAKCYYAKGEDTSWTLATGSKTFSTTARCHFCPIRDIDANYNDEDKVLILNGNDTLAYLDINTLTVVSFTALAAASLNAVNVGSGLSGSSTFPQRYRVTAGNRGETAATSVTFPVSTSAPRSEWLSGATPANNYIDIVINRVPNAQRYHIYYGTETGQEVYLTSVDDPGSGTTVTFRDFGSIDPNTNRPAPVGDTTAGPIGTRASFINGQVFITGDKVNPKYVRYGGTDTGILDFSPYNGGGYQPVGGNKEIPVRVASFRKNDGTPAITVLCNGTNGLGKRYIMTPATIGNTSYFAVSEENGNDGTEAPDSVIFAQNQLWYLSRDGGKTTLTKAQIQTILSTDTITDTIQKDVDKLNSKTLELSWGLTYKNRLHWAVSTGGTKNDQIWTLDLNNLRKGAWMLPWQLNADWGWLYNDNTGQTHFLTISNNIIYEFSDSVTTQDDGVAFPTGMSTGIFTFSPDGQMWAEVLWVIFIVQRPLGSLNASVSGKTEDGPASTVASTPYNATTDVVGWDEYGWDQAGWDDTGHVPKTFGIDRTEIAIDMGGIEMNYLSCDFSTVAANSDYEVTDIILEYIETGLKR